MTTTKQLHSYEDHQTLEMHTNEKAEDHLGDYDNEADEDILSLCDLSINNQTCHPDEEFESNKIESHDEISSLPLQSSSFGENQENIFEFFSEEWNVNTTTTPPTTTLVTNPVISNPKTKNIVTPTPKRSNSTRMVHRKSNNSIFTKSKSYGSSTSTVSTFASPVKSKLLLVLFGLPPKIPTDQAKLMTDIKMRQSRHAPATFFPSNGANGCGDDHETVRRTTEIRMWRFIKAATCFSCQRRDNDVV